MVSIQIFSKYTTTPGDLNAVPSKSCYRRQINLAHDIAQQVETVWHVGVVTVVPSYNMIIS